MDLICIAGSLTLNLCQQQCILCLNRNYLAYVFPHVYITACLGLGAKTSYTGPDHIKDPNHPHETQVKNTKRNKP